MEPTTVHSLVESEELVDKHPSKASSIWALAAKLLSICAKYSYVDLYDIVLVTSTDQTNT
jgi:hypothetical protein